MNKPFGALAVSVTLIAAVSVAAPATAAPQVEVQPDRTGDVQTKLKGVRSEKAPRFIKQSIDLKRVRYDVDRSAPVPKLRVTYKARNVLRASVARDQRFRTHFDDEDRYAFAWFYSTDSGPVEVWRFDRGGLYRVRCPRARVKLLPGPRKSRVVQVVPTRCLEVLGGRAYMRSSTRVVPFQPKRFVSADRAPETDLVTLG